MAFQILKTYDFKKTKLVIGPVVIGGYGDDGGVEYEPVSDIGEMTYGADGEATFSRQNIKGLIATITLKETSNSIAQLDALRRAQQAFSKIPPLNYNHFDPLTGDKVKSTYAVFKNWAAPSKSRNAGDRTFVIELPYSAAESLEGPFNAIPI